MSARFRPSFLLINIVLGLNFIVPAHAISHQLPAGSGPDLNIEQVVGNLVQQNAERAEALRSYEGRRVYTLDYRGLLSHIHSQMVVDITYVAPDTKKFSIVSQSGPKWMVDQVLKRLIRTEAGAQQNAARTGVDLNAENYTFTNLQVQPASDGCEYQVDVNPKIPSKLLYRGRLWINARDFAVCRIQAAPAKNPSIWIKSTSISQKYSKMGEFWLPEKNTSTSKIRLGGRATLTIQYEDYKILQERALQSVAPSVAPQLTAAEKIVQ